MPFPRATGILLHPTSLPARGGIGDFGPAAYRFLDFLVASRQGLWQVLPLGPLGYGNSPYSSTSAFAGNPLLISLERLAERGWLDPQCLKDLSEAVGPVKYDAEFARRDSAALKRVREERADDLEMRKAMQFAFYEQWRALRHGCIERSIRVVGDFPIFVNYDSADVWTHPELFRLDEERNPEVVSGVPPDFFSQTGQRWGNPLYRWDVMQEQGYRWWIDRMRWATQTCYYIRLDHFRGFDQFWEIPATEPTAIHGRWVDGPKDELFNKLRDALGGLPFFAEDLGHIT